jgi:hypothetical protein
MKKPKTPLATEAVVVPEVKPISTYQGSEKSRAAVVEEIKIHPQLGPKYAKNFDPFHDAMTFNAWRRQGYVPSKGSIGIKTVTFIDSEDAGEKKMIPRTVILFHRSQVQALSPYKLKQKQTV